MDSGRHATTKGERSRSEMKARHPGGGRSRAWSVYLLLGSLVAFGFFLLSGTLHGFMYDLVYDFVGISAVVAILVGARVNRPESLLPWHLFALGQLMFVAGDVVLNYYENVLRVEAPFPSASDAFWLTGYPLLIFGLLMLIRQRAPGRDWAGLIDATIIATSMGVFSWVFLMRPYADDPTLSILEQIISIMYPLMDVVLVAVVARLAIASGARTTAFSLLTLSLMFLLAADTVYAKMLLDGTYYTGSLPDLGFLLSYVLWGAAALHPAMGSLSEPAPERGVRLTRTRIALLAAIAVSVPSIRAIQMVRDVPVNSPVVIVGSMLLAVLVVARMAVFVRQHEHSVAREKILRRAGADLVAAPDRTSIYGAALRTVLELAGDVSGIRASVVVGDEEAMYVAASAGDDAESARGRRIIPSRLPNELRPGLAGQSAVVSEHLDSDSVRVTLGLAPKAQTVYINPLLAQDNTRIALVVATDSKLPEEFRDGLEALASQVALALESEALAEDLHMRQSEERFRALVQNASELILIFSPEGEARYVSPSARRMLGRDPEDTSGANIFEWVHAEDAAQMRDAISRCVGERSVVMQTELRFLHADGSRRLFEVAGTNMLEEPTVGGLVFNARDITDRKHAEEALRDAEFRFRTLVEQMPAVTYINPLDLNEPSIYISPQIKNLVGYSVEEGREDPDLWDRILHPDDQERVAAAEARANEDGAPFGVEYREISKDGRVVWIRDESILVRDEKGEPQYWQGFMWDISDRKQAEEALREAEAKYRTLVEQVPAVIYIQEFGESETMRYLSPQFEAIFGYSLKERMQSPEHWINMVHPDDRDAVRAGDLLANQSGEPFKMEYRQLTKDGRTIWIRDEAILVRDEKGQGRFWQGVMMDVTERKVLEEQLAHQAFHDSLTGLPNRVLFGDRLQHALDRSVRHEGRVAVLFLDLDEFKVINDSLGHKAGDQLLVEVSERLKRCVRPGDTVARLGGDEFTVLLEDALDAEQAIGVAERISEELSAPVMLEGHEVFVTTSVGISMGSSGQDQPENFLRNADVAMYEAKNNGKARYAIFDPDMDARALERLQLETDIRHALKEEEFTIHYQPLVDLRTGRISEVEALVRWEHPRRGLLPPGKFIPLAEKTGLIVPLGRWVLEESCKQLRFWQTQLEAGRSLTLSVNLSPKQFQHPELVEDIARVIEESAIDPGTLKLEITEGVMMEDADANVAILQRLREMGIQLAIDDFGTGYSSLSYLKRFPVSVLKIDRSFIEGLGHIEEDTAVVSATVAFAKSMGLSVTAEGIETAEQLDHVKALGCDLGQGYHFHKPLPGDAVSLLLLEGESTSSRPGSRAILNAGGSGLTLLGKS